MKRLFSTRVSDSALSTALLILRLGFGGIMALDHGWAKLTTFNQTLAHFPGMFGMSPSVALSMTVFAEFFCAVFVVLGLFTRLACIPLIITMGVAFIKVHNMNYHSIQPGNGQMALLFLIAFIALLFTGPGKVSLDRAIGK